MHVQGHPTQTVFFETALTDRNRYKVEFSLGCSEELRFGILWIYKIDFPLLNGFRSMIFFFSLYMTSKELMMLQKEKKNHLSETAEL